MACDCGTPRGCRNNTNSPSRTPRPGDRDGQHLGDEHGGHERQQRGGADRGGQVEGLGGHERRADEDQLVREAGGQDAAGGGRLVGQLADAEPHGAGEAPPALVVLELALDALALAGGEDQHDDQEQRACRRRWRRRSSRPGPSSRRPGLMTSAGEREDRQHDPAAHALEHHRGERGGRLAVVLGQAGDPEGVAADRARAARCP